MFEQVTISLKVMHYGIDEWQGDWIKLHFDDGSAQTCLPNPMVKYPANTPVSTFLIDYDDYMFATCK
jgi:hypothetical protein